MMGCIRRMTEQGDTAVLWDVEEETQKEAKEFFNDGKSMGYANVGYRQEGGGQVVGEVLPNFDPTMDEIIQTPPMVGG